MSTNLISFLQDLGFAKHDAIDILSPLGDADNNYSKNSYSSKLYCDKFFTFINTLYKINVFFGKDNIVVSIFTTMDKQKEFSKALFNYFSL